MSTAIGVALFVIGVGALLLSLLMDRRRPSRKASPAAATAVASEEPGQADPGVDEPTVVAPEAVERAAAEDLQPPEAPRTETPPTPEPAELPVGGVPAVPEEPAPGAVDAPGDKAAAAEARLAQLRAELVRTPSSETHAAVPEPSAAPETRTRTEAGRVFAAVASVGRAPEEPVDQGRPFEEAARGVAAPEIVGAPAALETEPPAGHRHAVPLVNHSDLVTHMRREHPDLGTGGSTIQMRLLHDRAHADEG